MALDAAERLRELIAVGEEIPYEVREPGDGSPLCRYEPQTEVFVHDHSSELRELDSFGAACAALEIAGLAAAVPGAHGDRRPRGSAQASRDRHASPSSAGCGWAARTSRSRPTASTPRSTRSNRVCDVDAGQIEVIVPLRGLQMPVARLELDPVSIVRADTVEVPAEARSSDGLGVSPWEPAFIAVVRVEERAWRRRQRRRPRRSRSLPPPDHHAAPVQGRRRRPRPARLDTDCRRPLAPDRDRLGSPAPGRVSPH